MLDPGVADRLKRDANGLIVAVIQQYDSDEVLMVGWMDDEALHRTLTTGRATFSSSSPSPSIAMAMPCWSKSIRWAWPAIPAIAPASMLGRWRCRHDDQSRRVRRAGRYAPPGAGHAHLVRR